MTDRNAQLTAFLARTQWAKARVEPLAGDASRRRYFRLFEPERDRRAILMDAPKELGEDVRPFLHVGDHLRGLGLSVPQTYDADIEAGFLVIEDFGDDVFDRVCAASPHLEPELYAAAVDVLVCLAQSAPLENAAPYDAVMTELAMSSVRWYVEPICGVQSEDALPNLRETLEPLITSINATGYTVLRDFHAQNLIWLPKRDGVRRVGLLDYQDAMTGPAAYDLMSLVKDARRDVSPELRETSMLRFAKALDLDLDEFSRTCAIVSAQRNLRILMVFARMSLHFQKPHYVDLIPRVWNHLMDDLTHPELGALRSLILEIYPAPTAKTLETLKAKCGTVLTL